MIASRTCQELTAEIAERFGFVPPFFSPAINNARVLENLWQQTLSAYVENPLPAMFKERLFAYLSRHCDVPYCIVCHSCALRPLGMKPWEILDLLESPALGATDSSETLRLLNQTEVPLQEWPAPGSELDRSLTIAAVCIFEKRHSAEAMGKAVRRALGERYQDLVEFLTYVSACFVWVEGHPELSYEADERAKQHLGPLLSEEPRLAKLFRTYTKRIRQQQKRKELEQERRRQEARFRAVAQTATDAIVIADERGAISYFNASAERIFGRSSAELDGQPLTLLIPARDHEAHLQGFRRYLETGEARLLGRSFERDGVRADGTEFPVEISLASWTADGTTAFAAILRDITDRKAAETELRQAKEEAEQASQELEAFSYSVAHDLRAPLRAISGYSKALIEDLGSKLDGEHKEYLTRMSAGANRMDQLIDALLGLSKVTRTALVVDSVNLTAVAWAVIRELQASEPDRKLEVVVESGLRARGDPGLLQLLVQNLLSNAWKFTAKAKEARIEVGRTLHDGIWTFFVRDNGAGFDAVYAAKLFAPFHRLHSTSEFPGTGIGLATVRRIVRRHGGWVWAEGATDKGAAFFFTLDEGQGST
jgi:PAS domain S-box-containing protein